MSSKVIYASNEFIGNFQSSIYSLPMYLYIHQLYLLEQHSELFKIRPAIISIISEGESFTLIFGQDVVQKTRGKHITIQYFQRCVDILVCTYYGLICPII